MKTFEFNGQKYKKASKHQKEWGNNLIAELSLNGNETILDLGCGDGVLTEKLGELVPNGSVLGIDTSIGMLEIAEAKKNNNLAFIQMDINDIHFRNKFDIIFSNATLHWIKNHTKLLKSVFSALKENGILLWDFAGAGNCSNFFEVIQNKIQDKKYKQYFSGFEWPWYMPTKADYEKVLVASEFSEYGVTEINRDRYFSNADEMIRWIDQPSIVPFISNIPDRIKKEFREDVIKSMLKKTLQPDGTCFETFRRIHVTARK